MERLVSDARQIWPDVPLTKIAARNHCGDNILTEQVLQHLEAEEPLSSEAFPVLENSTLDVSLNQCLIKVGCMSFL